jgi:hypothetical protein
MLKYDQGTGKTERGSLAERRLFVVRGDRTKLRVGIGELRCGRLRLALGLPTAILF